MDIDVAVWASFEGVKESVDIDQEEEEQDSSEQEKEEEEEVVEEEEKEVEEEEEESEEEGSSSSEEDSSEEEGAMVRIGFLLEDKLKVFGEGENASEVIMKQCCYEQKIISMRFSKIEDMDNLTRKVRRILLNDLHMHPQSAELAIPRVATTISDRLVPISEVHNDLCTILLEVHVECWIKKRGGGAREPSGEHGYERLRECVSDEQECSICQEEFSSSKDITVTTCHHIYHLSCIKQWLRGTNESCPICRFDLGPMVGLALPL